MTPPTAAAPILNAQSMVLRYDGNRRELSCLYVQVDAKLRRDVSDFLANWRSCCDEVAIDWQAMRRPPSALVGFELRHCCGESPGALRLVFDVRRDRDALDVIARTESIVVGNRPHGGFANSMAAYGVDGDAVRRAIRAAGAGSARSFAS